MKGRHIGEFEELVLLAVHGLAGDAYGVSVQRLLARETTREVSLGAVYAALERLESKGFVQSEVVAGTPVRGGRSRRAFAVTPLAIRTLGSLRELRDRLYGAGRSKPSRARS